MTGTPVEFGPATRRVLADEVTDQLRDAIVTGVLEPGAAPETGALEMTRLSIVVPAAALPEPDPFAVQSA